MGCLDLCKIKSTEVVWHDGQQQAIKMYKMYKMELDPVQFMFMIQLPKGVQVKRSYTTGTSSTCKADGHEHIFLISEGIVPHLVFITHSPCNAIIVALIVHLSAAHTSCEASNWQQSILNINIHGINMLQSWKGPCDIGPALTCVVIDGWKWADMAVQMSIHLLEETQSKGYGKCIMSMLLHDPDYYQTMWLGREIGEGTDTLAEEEEDQ